MKPYSNHKHHHFSCRYGCCKFRKNAIKARCLKKGARQMGRDGQEEYGHEPETLAEDQDGNAYLNGQGNPHAPKFEDSGDYLDG